MCIHTHPHTVTLLYLKGAQCVTRGGINYLNLSDLPSFLAPLSQLFFFCSFSLSLPSCEHTSLHLNFSHFFFNPSAFPHWSSLPPPVDMWLLFQDVKPLLPIYLSLPPPSYSPPLSVWYLTKKALKWADFKGAYWWWWWWREPAKVYSSVTIH